MSEENQTYLHEIFALGSYVHTVCPKPSLCAGVLDIDLSRTSPSSSGVFKRNSFLTLQ